MSKLHISADLVGTADRSQANLRSIVSWSLAEDSLD